MKYFFILFNIVIISCNTNQINYATLSYENKNGSWDSIILQNKSDLDLINMALKNKTFIGAKFPREYQLRIVKNDSSTEDYDGNGSLLRDDYIYFIKDTNLQKQFLELINSKLPYYKKQSGIIKINSP